MKKALSLATLLSLAGCATIINDPTIPLTVTFSDGSAGECTFRNKRGAWTAQIPTSSVMIRRSDDALLYECTTADDRRSTGAIRSEMEGGKLAASVVFWDLGITDSITDKHRTYQGNFVIPIRPRESATERVGESQALTPLHQPRQNPSGMGRVERGY
ncbi:MAG: hypothetical protein ACOY6E_12755 [Pseudomonadota bacterium]